MSARFVSVDRNRALLLPPDLRDWVPQDDLVRFVVEAINSLPSERFHFNPRGSWGGRYPRSMMQALFVDSIGTPTAFFRAGASSGRPTGTSRRGT